MQVNSEPITQKDHFYFFVVCTLMTASGYTEGKTKPAIKALP